MEIRKIGAVVVLYNPTIAEYKNIYAYCSKLDELILVDNSPVPDSETVDKFFSDISLCRIRYLPSDTNLGLCGGMNKGIQIAAEDGCDWCYTNNPDSKFGNDLTSIFKNIILNENDDRIAVLGPQYSYDRKKLKKCKGIYDVDFLMMSGNLVNVSIFQKMGGFDERLFLDGLDIEFCMRLKKNGYRILECREAILLHQPAITKEVRLLCYTLKYGWDKPVRYYYQIRADVFIFRNYKTMYALKDIVIRLLKILLLFHDKKSYLIAFQKGVCDSFAEKWGEYK